MNVLSVVGARPQFVKAATIARAFAGAGGVRHHLLHTGQHYDHNMSEVFFDELEIPPAQINLGIGSDTHGRQTARMLIGIEQALDDMRPDWVIVYGDTNSTLAATLAAAKMRIRVAHVEAGLRSRNRAMPEEINRVLTDHASDLLFAPTEAAMRHLQSEGLPAERCQLVGDVMYDATRFFAAKASRHRDTLNRLGLTAGRYLLATIHRAENTDDPQRLGTIIEGLAAVAEGGMPVLAPIHPRTRGALDAAGLAEAAAPLRLIDPVGYLDMAMLEQHAALIATDSGGVQKEAFFHGVPCVTLRDETEWTELIDCGWNHLAPPGDAPRIAQVITQRLAAGPPHHRPDGLYGNGEAGQRIVQALCRTC